MRNKLVELYELAEASDIDVDWFLLGQEQSLSVKLPDGATCIAIDPREMDTLATETVHLAHELGHCKTGAFYNRWAARDIRQKHEYRADKWAIKKLVPKDELLKAIKSGHINIWDLAEYFSVTEDFMKKAMHWYTYGNLAIG